MNKIYSHTLHKKYHDEVWGRLVLRKKFSYNKRSVLLNYKAVVLKRRIRLKNKYRYFKWKFLKCLRLTYYNYRALRKRVRYTNVLIGEFSNVDSSKKSSLVSKFFLFKKHTCVPVFRASSQTFKMLRKKSFYPLENLKIFPNKFLSRLYPDYSLRRVAIRKVRKFWGANNIRYAIKKRLKLKRQRRFFYSVHIAAPRKKKKKKSLFALKHIYYRKVSYFFGFKKVSSFFNSYNSAKKLYGGNQFAVFLMLEAKIDNLLFRINFFPTLYFVKKFIRNGNIFVDNYKIKYDSYILGFNEIVSINRRYFKLVYTSIKSRLKRRRVLLNRPDFVEVDYKLLVAMLTRNPTVKSLTRPVSFELYTKFLTYHKYG